MNEAVIRNLTLLQLLLTIVWINSSDSTTSWPVETVSGSQQPPFRPCSVQVLNTQHSSEKYVAAADQVGRRKRAGREEKLSR